MKLTKVTCHRYFKRVLSLNVTLLPTSKFFVFCITDLLPITQVEVPHIISISKMNLVNFERTALKVHPFFIHCTLKCSFLRNVLIFMLSLQSWIRIHNLHVWNGFNLQIIILRLHGGFGSTGKATKHIITINYVSS